MRALSEEHMEQHYREDREKNRLSMQEFAGRPPKNYDVLIMSTQDIAFLKTRGVKIDAGIEHDSCIEYNPVSEKEQHLELPRSIWRKILERAWNH